MKLNIGCGNKLEDGWVNVDRLALVPGVTVWDLTNRWPIEDGSVEEILASHVIEHFDSGHRCFVWNEMYRVMSPGAKATVIVPHWANNRAYGDPTHKWPPVSEMAFYYLSKAWRDTEAPHCNDLLTCDFEVTWGYTLPPSLAARNVEYQQFALNNYANAAMEIHATLTKKG